MDISSLLLHGIRKKMMQVMQYLNTVAFWKRSILVSTVMAAFLSPIVPRRWIRVSLRYTLLTPILPMALFADLLRSISQLYSKLWLRIHNVSVATNGIDESEFASKSYFTDITCRLFDSGLRSTASKAHEDFVSWVEGELSKIPNIEVHHDEYEILRWQTTDARFLKKAGRLVVHKDDGDVDIDIAGAVPYSQPVQNRCGKLLYVPLHQSLSGIDLEDRIVLRELPQKSLPLALGRLPSYSTSQDMSFDYFGMYERPSFWEHPIHNDLVDAGKSGAAGVIFLIDLPRSQVSSYWDPHQGTHYHVPAIFCAAEDMDNLKALARRNIRASMHVLGEISPATTRNVFATLPGRIPETIVYATHTDGNTCVQDNGVAALLALAHYFAKQPLSSRRRTIQFAFNTAHLHVSKEGSGRHAAQLDVDYDAGSDVVLVIPVEHLGTRELEAYPTSDDSTGRILRFTGQGEIMIWCVGPSAPVVAAVRDAVVRRKLDRVLITRGVGLPRFSVVPTFASFGGLGTLYHKCLIPTTSLISGPWSLFAPSFGKEAVDVERIRSQTLALGDIYLALENVSRAQIAGGYLEYRRRRAANSEVHHGFVYPPERL